MGSTSYAWFSEMEAAMEAQLQRVISEDCRLAINQVASFQLHVSDAYLSMVSMGSWATMREVSALIWVMLYFLCPE